MKDLELIGYFRIHSRTERRLFARGHVVRLIALAGREKSDFNISSDFLVVGSDIADELCDEAERRLRGDERRLRNYDEHPDYELPHRKEES